MDISQVDSVSGPAPQSGVPQAPILVRPTEGAGQSVDGMLPATPLVPASVPPTIVDSTPSLVPPTPEPTHKLTTPLAASPTAPQVPTQPVRLPILQQPLSPTRPINAAKPAPAVPGGVAPSTVVIDKVFETPAEAKAQMVSQVPPAAEPAPALDVPLTAKKDPKLSLPILIGMIVGGVILLAGVAFLTISTLSKKSVNSTTPTGTMAQPVVMNSSDIVGIVSKTVPGSSSAQGLSGPTYQVAKATYSITPPADAAISYPAVDTAAATAVYGKVLPFLTANGLMARAVSAGTTKSNTGGIFDATGTHCQVTTGTKTFLLACSNTKTYEDTTTKLAPAYTVFTTARPVDKTKQPQTLSITRWSASKTQGYAIADINITDVTVGASPVDHLFYQMPDKSWHYVGEALSTTGCGNFNTPDLKKAFLGEPCMSGTTNATVVLQ